MLRRLLRLQRILLGAWNGPPNLAATLRLEWRFVAVRWVGIFFMAAGVRLTTLSTEQMAAAYGVLAVAAIYNAGLQVLLPRRPLWFKNGYLTAVGDTLLNAFMVGMGGGFDSPLYYLLFTVTISAAMRYGYGPALGMASLFIAFDAAGHLPYGLLNGSFLFRSGFLLITGLLAGYLREQAHRAEIALQGRLRQATLFNEATARLTATLEADATLRAVTEAASLLLGGGCAVLRPAPELAAAGEDGPSVSYYGTTACPDKQVDLLALCDQYVSRTHGHELRSVVVDRRMASGERARILVLERPGQTAPLGVLAVQLPRPAALTALAPDIMDSFAERCALALENVLLYRARTNLYEEVRRQADALQENEVQLRAVLDNVAEGIITVDDYGQIASFNRAAEYVFGYHVDEVLRQPFRSLLGDPADAGEALIGYWQPQGKLTGIGAREAIGRHKAGTTFPMDMAVSEMAVDAHKQFIICVRDITERKQAEQALQHQALHDMLTELPNRILLQDRLEQALMTVRQREEPLALLVMDLDRFKDINDTFGHHAGDQLLRQIGPRVQGVLRNVDSLARLGGDEFALVLPNTNQRDANAICARLLEALDSPFVIDDRTVSVGASIGIAVSPDHGLDAETLLRRADMAMYVAKRAGAGYAVYTADQDGHSSMRLALFGELRGAIDRNELVLHYQPKVECATGAIGGVEALVRWQHPQRGLVPPDEFIPLAEQTGLIKPLSLWVLNAAIAQLRAWRQSGMHVPVAVNLSMLNLHDPQLPDVVADLLERYGVPADELILELTESHLMADPERSLDILARLRTMGIRLAVDDFGTGYSSLTYLKRLPVNELKIDRSFVRHLVTDENDAAIVRSTISLGHDLGLSIVAEGVEDEATQDHLRALGCDLIQGYYISRPLPVAQMTSWIHNIAGSTQSTGLSLAA
ncbi:MAG: putative bifunctional diguanylate cyclase/phosphodiesterase [Chloroflexota bacterium]